MKIKIIKEEVLEGIQKASGIVPQKTGAAFLRTIWLRNKDDQLHIMSTDSNLEFYGIYPGQTIEEGLIGVQGRNFFDLFKKLPPGEVHLKTDAENKTLLLEQGKRKYKLPTFDSSWFEEFSSFPQDKATTCSGQFLRELIEKISYCISEDKDEVFHCMKISPEENENYLEVCGLNGYQFALQRFSHAQLYSVISKDGILLAKPYLLELKKWLGSQDINLSLDEKRIFFANEEKSEIFSFPVNYGNFPNYESFLSCFDQETSKMVVNKDELIDSLDRIYVFNTETQRACYFVFGENELVLYSQDQEKGEATESIYVDYKGNLSTIAFPTKNLLEILHHFDSSELCFEFSQSDGPCKITGNDSDEDYMLVVMPISIEEETYYTEETIE